MSDTQARWRDPTPLARPIRVLQWVLAALCGVMATLDVTRFSFTADLPGPLPTSRMGRPILDLVSLVGAAAGLVYGLVLLVAGVLSLRWIVRTSRNAHLSAQGLTVSPAWAAGWFFVPIAGLWKPFHAMRETWCASVDPLGWNTMPPPRLLRWWWALFLISSLLGSISSRLELGAHTAGQQSTAALVSLAVDLTSLAMALAFGRVVKRLTAVQVGRPTGAAAFDASHVFGL